MDFKGKRILITGGTGSCGHQLVARLLKEKPKEIRIFSRDEKKQFDMKYETRNHPNVTFMIGDIRDFDRVKEAMAGIDVVFNTAAMKHVNASEQNVYEAVKTNINGIRNIARAAIESGVPRVVSLSTDKAVEPVNVMGMTKAVGERIITEANFSPLNKGTKLCCVRYGNVMNSRGSVIPFFKALLEKDEVLTITHPEMTRFMLTLGDAIDLVMFAVEHMEGGEVFVKKAPAVYIKDLAESLSKQAKKPFRFKIIGTFPGEKIHEVLVSESEKSRAVEHSGYFVIKQKSTDSPKKADLKEYCSHGEVVSAMKIPELLKRADHEQRSGELDTFQKETIA